MGPDLNRGRGHFGGYPLHGKASRAFAVVYAIMAEPIVMPFG